ncbi:M57 family metalloprotease [Nocardioides gansuensis]|uniref:M57 family metalloprotease n=1 Tax=Nocardioides gansuensis TaxID=2138300 RepID=UPI001BAA4127|nr:M57 family metalloprotease [Nocardioides gansuensis]
MSARPRALALAGAAVLASSLAAPAAATLSSGDAVPTFREYEAQTYVDTDKQYIVNGDEPVADTGRLRQYYDVLTGNDVHGHKTLEEGLVVNTVFGRDDKWSATQAMNLTYCISDKFGSQKTNVVNAMNAGVALWEQASSKVDYIHVPAADSNCTTRNNAVLFSVEPTSTTQYIARAFFPSTSDRGRNILVNAASLTSSGSWTPGNIMGHELGHTLGFRHEHTRPESGTCFEDNNWRPLTPYDSASIMHYPQCNGTSDDLSMTASDRAGVQALYGA